MATDHEAWLNLTMEAPIEPELLICDPHHHLWERPNNYYFPEEFLKDTASGHNIVKSVFIECSTRYRKDGLPELQPVGETEFVQSIADKIASGDKGKTAVAAGIVGFAEFTIGEAVMPVLEAHLAASSNRFRGIRYSAPWDASPEVTPRRSRPKGLLLEAKFREGFACLQKYGLSFEAWLYYPQLPELADLAKAFPGITIILNHTGAPLGVGPYAGKRMEVFRDWQQKMMTVVSCPNVFVKLGGLGMPVCGFGWNEQVFPPGSTELAEAIAPYFNWCIEHFGVDRCMFESNFPSDRVSYSYTVLWNAFKRFSKGFSPRERAALFYDTAVKVYRL
jgi:predicted TIM-barrel fold metal-dependent hydrolase